jgi:cytochrome b561
VTQSSVVTALVILLVSWRIYVRFKRLVGRQKSRVWRHWIAAILFPILTVLIALPTLLRPLSAGALGAGLVAGVGLGIWGLRLTQFETTPIAYYYTPNAHLGIALSLLMVARILYRVFEATTMTAAERATHMQDFARSPLTLVIFGTLAAYYTTYAIGILLWRNRTPLPGSVPAEASSPVGTL